MNTNARLLAHECSLPVIKFYYFFITRGNDTRNKHKWCLLHHECLFQLTLPEELHEKRARVYECLFQVLFRHNALWNSVIIVVMALLRRRIIFFQSTTLCIVNAGISFPAWTVNLCECRYLFADTNYGNTVSLNCAMLVIVVMVLAVVPWFKFNYISIF